MTTTEVERRQLEAIERRLDAQPAYDTPAAQAALEELEEVMSRIQARQDSWGVLQPTTTVHEGQQVLPFVQVVGKAP